MEKQHKSIEEMWNNYLIKIGEDKNSTDKKYEAWYFGNNEEMANELGELVRNGTKKATASLDYWYNVKGEKVPEVGDVNIITDWDGIGKCIIEIIKIITLPFKDVTKKFAKIEGEGDKSLEYWRKEHQRFFKESLEEENIEFSEDMLVVCEEFEVVYKIND